MATPEYTHHLRHAGIKPADRVMSTDTPATCPPVLQPHDIHFMVINMDRSVKRLERITARFAELRLGMFTAVSLCHQALHCRLPMFERIPGVEVVEGVTYDVPMFYHPDTFRNGRPPIADYGCALAHRRAWQAVVDGPHEWVMLIEVTMVLFQHLVIAAQDDTELLSTAHLTKFPPVPAACDLVMLWPETILAHEPVCRQTSIRWLHWGYGSTGPHAIPRPLVTHRSVLAAPRRGQAAARPLQGWLRHGHRRAHFLPQPGAVPHMRCLQCDLCSCA